MSSSISTAIAPSASLCAIALLEVVRRGRIDRARDRHDVDVTRRRSRAAPPDASASSSAAARASFIRAPRAASRRDRAAARPPRLGERRQRLDARRPATRTRPCCGRRRSPRPAARRRSRRSGRSPCARACGARTRPVAALGGEADDDAVALVAADLREDVGIAHELEREPAPSGRSSLRSFPATACAGRKSATAAALITIVRARQLGEHGVAHRERRLDVDAAHAGGRRRARSGPRPAPPRRRAAPPRRRSRSPSCRTSGCRGSAPRRAARACRRPSPARARRRGSAEPSHGAMRAGDRRGLRHAALALPAAGELAATRDPTTRTPRSRSTRHVRLGRGVAPHVHVHGGRDERSARASRARRW